jgi:hypothetical protein
VLAAIASDATDTTHEGAPNLTQPNVTDISAPAMCLLPYPLHAVDGHQSGDILRKWRLGALSRSRTKRSAIAAYRAAPPGRDLRSNRGIAEQKSQGCWHCKAQRWATISKRPQVLTLDR